MTTFYKNYLSLCAEKKTSLSRVAEEIGLSRTAPNGWKKGKIPSDVTVEKLAQYFCVPAERLTGEIKEEAPATKAAEAERKFLCEVIDSADPEELQKIREYIEFIKSRR